MSLYKIIIYNKVNFIPKPNRELRIPQNVSFGFYLMISYFENHCGELNKHYLTDKINC